MRSTTRLAISLIVILLTLLLGMVALLGSAWMPRFENRSITGIPISVGSAVDLDALYAAAKGTIDEILPGAEYTGLTFFSRGADLPDVRGRIVFHFQRVRPAIPRPQVVEAHAEILTQAGSMDVSATDRSRFAVRTDIRPSVASAATFKEVVAVAHRRIGEQALLDCEVTISQYPDGWDVYVSCSPAHNSAGPRGFAVIDGEVAPLPSRK